MYAAAPSSSRVAAAAAAFFIVISLSPQLLVRPFGASTTVHWAAAQELDEEDFSYRRNAGNGPARWGLIRREWATCNVGLLQSPIGLSDTLAGLADRSGRLGRSYRPAAASLVNRGHSIMVRFNSNPGGVVIDGVAYRLRQMHWHAPSEHAINGRRYALELQMVHQSDTNRYAVVSQLYRISRRRPDRTIHRLERYIRRIARRKNHEELIDEEVDPRRPVSRSTAYYKYTGSFTTPPCTEGVTWVVAHQVKRLSTATNVCVTRRHLRPDTAGDAAPGQAAAERRPRRHQEQQEATPGSQRQGHHLLLHLAGARPRGERGLARIARRRPAESWRPRAPFLSRRHRPWPSKLLHVIDVRQC
ncbi:uncharacterized isoform X1 [Zea mays]|uniref:uncharacterized isoform X1 n=1 Tax=Zea mays TaxID=4577 RepID=UPI000220B388|nr:uncharacterized protein LOC100279972 isoform X1 [Zea mays]|eukprot:XP_020399216.1 uncharacterized LOC100279972 isoform X1 [Zea mays]